MYKIAVLMTVHNRCQKTVICLESLFKQKVNNFILEVYLTDDGCTDETVTQVKLKFPKVHIIEGDGNLYWNRGMLIAWKEAVKDKPDYFMWLNDDVELFDDAVFRLLESAIKTGNKSIIVGSMLSSETDRVLTYGGRKINRAHTVIEPDKKKLISCFALHGNLVLIPYYVFSILGFNDSYYHHSFGDVDYGLSAIKLGLKNYISPGYYGYCKKNNPIPLFRRKEYSLIERIRILYSPLGYNPIEDFHQNIKFYNWTLCVLWFIKLNINVFFAKDHTKYKRLE